MTHTLTAHLGLCNLYTTLFTDYAAMLQSLVLAAETLKILYWSEDLGTEKTVTFRLVGSVVDSFRLLDLTMRPGSDQFRGCQRNFNKIELVDLALILSETFN